MAEDGAFLFDEFIVKELEEDCREPLPPPTCSSTPISDDRTAASTVSEATTNTQSSSKLVVDAKSRVLKARECSLLVDKLLALDHASICRNLVSSVSKGLHYDLYPERKSFWLAIKDSKALETFVLSAQRDFADLYQISS